ncbi:transcriptional repressor LexA [cf. Phormidesmis sp. LEGE 11477]|uniref:transcriptional repressor LexA n=1 Tax=cf. Phormidesmis sp. LEGE 11477 TaxID=1828680 RepID=UPI00187F570A|nr:transcriptional repressor LexA [cf. Phormidesmis sp. LEGE 11477]MBE9062753.1 repressor LexA [cf. Phormidesmis sp. LEGE 11477]
MEPLTHAQQELYDWLVVYIRENRHSPSIRQMMREMKLKSPAPVQSRLEHLRRKGYIDWKEGQARTIRIIKDNHGVPIFGAIAAGSIVETFADTLDADESLERFDPTALDFKGSDFALRVRGDSMIEALIDDGDIVIMRKVQDPKRIRNGTIVAARVESAMTLKYYHFDDGKVTLKPANPRFAPMEYPAAEVSIDGELVGVWRSRGLG